MMNTLIMRRGGIGRWFTPRKVVWIALLLGLGWFVWVSPKTPLAFFDAAGRDADFLQRRATKVYEQIDPAKAAAVRKVDEMDSCRRRINRLALVHDLANHPKRIGKQRGDILLGFYEAKADTEAALMAENPEYHALKEKYETLRAEVKDERLWKAANDLRAEMLKGQRRRVGVFVLQMQQTMIRGFQAQIFWRGGR